MIYFINEYLMAWNSGIEHAEIKRLHMFKDANIPAKLITRNYDPLTAQNRNTFHLNSNQILNMFDYFQDAVDVKSPGPNQPKIDALQLAPAYSVMPGADVSKVYDGDQQIMAVHFAPGTYGQLYQVDYFDAFGKVVQTTLWDFRGFKSRDQFYGPNGELISQVSYTPTGKAVIHEYFSRNDQNQSYVSLIELDDYHHQHLFFNNYDELFAFFLDEIAKQDEHAIMVADRPGVAYEALLNMEYHHVKRFVTLPTIHTADMKDPVYANLSGLYNDVIVERGDQLNGVIVATERQKNDLTLWEGGAQRLKAPIYAASFAIVPNKQIIKDHIPLAQRTKHKLIAVTRLLADRRTNDIINAFAKVLQHYPDATLDIYGYGDQFGNLSEQIKQQKLAGRVTLKNYVVDLAQAYDDAQIYVNATDGDAEPLAIAEALSHGLPTAAYDVFYGPQEMISQGRNGYLVQHGDVNGLARAIELMMSDDQRWEKMSAAAYQQSRNFSESAVLPQWKKALGISSK